MVDIVVATGNEHKLHEIRKICGDGPVRFRSMRDVWNSTPAIPETGVTFEENAVMKARWVQDRLGGWVLADDSGLEVTALAGRPGVYSARYAGEGAADGDNRRLLLHELREIPAGRRQARFRCVLALIGPEGRRYIAEGACEGTVGFAERGEGGFGYDSLFTPLGYNQTFAELAPEVKNSISHRANALQQLGMTLDELFRTE